MPDGEEFDELRDGEVFDNYYDDPYGRRLDRGYDYDYDFANAQV